MNRCTLFAFLLIIICHFPLFSQLTDILDSGGPLMPEQAAYDVKEYELSLEVNPKDSSIQGFVQTKAQIVHPVYWFVLDIDTVLEEKEQKNGINWLFPIRDIFIIMQMRGVEKKSALKDYFGKNKVWSVYDSHDIKPFFIYFLQMASNLAKLVYKFFKRK